MKFSTVIYLAFFNTNLPQLGQKMKKKKNCYEHENLKKKSFFQAFAKLFVLLIFEYGWYIRVWQTIIFKTYFEFFVSECPILRLTVDSAVTFFFCLKFGTIYRYLIKEL